MNKIAALLALLIGLVPTIAVGQVNTQAMPANSVMGRLGIPTQGGPAQAIPFASLVQALAAAQATCLANTVMAGPTSGAAARPACRSLVANDIPAGLIPTPTTVGYATRAAAVAATISSAVTSVFIQGYTTANDGGGGWYTRLAGVPGPVKAWHFQSADGTYWLLNTSAVLPRQVGAALDDSTDDTTAIQAWVDYGIAFGVPSLGQVGTARVPTGVIDLAANTNVDGLGKLTLKRTTDTVAALMECNADNNISVQNVNFTTTAGFGSTSSNTIGLTIQNYTVPAGLTGLVVNEFVQITSVASPTNYMIARINSYSGTTLNVTATTAVGAGTLANWYIDVYPRNGVLADANIALRFKTCSQVLAAGNVITGRFYDGIDSRDGSNVRFIRNSVTGVVNRGLHVAAYNVLAKNNQILNNLVEGSSFTQYCINSSGTDAGIMQSLLIEGNAVNFCNFQGIEAGGQVQWGVIANNNVIMEVPGASSVGILVQSIGADIAQRISVANNTVQGGLVGIHILDTIYYQITGNRVTSAGTGIILQGTTATANVYGTVTGNGVDNCTVDGISAIASVANGVLGLVITGNMAAVNTGIGAKTDANTANFAIVGNAFVGNGTASSLLGTSHTAASNE